MLLLAEMMFPGDLQSQHVWIWTITLRGPLDHHRRVGHPCQEPVKLPGLLPQALSHIIIKGCQTALFTTSRTQHQLLNPSAWQASQSFTADNWSSPRPPDWVPLEKANPSHTKPWEESFSQTNRIMPHFAKSFFDPCRLQEKVTLHPSVREPPGLTSLPLPNLCSSP